MSETESGIDHIGADAIGAAVIGTMDGAVATRVGIAGGIAVTAIVAVRGTATNEVPLP